MGWITEQDPPKAQALEARWERCSERAREFAILQGYRWPGYLPHVIAELYDQGAISGELESCDRQNGK